MQNVSVVRPFTNDAKSGRDATLQHVATREKEGKPGTEASQKPLKRGI
jgi:hypothetical protein